jgi:hypothetical protein
MVNKLLQNFIRIKRKKKKEISLIENLFGRNFILNLNSLKESKLFIE